MIRCGSKPTGRRWSPGGPRRALFTTGGSDAFAYAKDRIGALKKNGPGAIRINKAGCLGRCDNGPVMVVYPEETWYNFIDHEDVEVGVDGVEERNVGVPECYRAEPGCSEDRDRQVGDRRLAVGTGDGEYRPWTARSFLFPAVRDLDLAPQWYSHPCSGSEEAVALGDARSG